jgi:6-pyruvoyl-tetrahydropterin synthase-like protein/uncharacterized protein DUF6077
LYPSSAGIAVPGSSLLWTPLLVIGLTAFAVEIPFFFFGTPSGHDVEFHLYSWLDVLAQWRQGIILPRWAALANFAAGEPRFLFYPPASWTLGALLTAIFPWTVASCVYIWIALVAAGSSMFLLVRRWLGRRDAIFAAALYAVNPYHLVIVYWRSAFAELLASCLLPLLFLLVLRAAEGERRVIVPLSLVLAAAWLTNAPAAVMVHYSLALLILFFAWQKRSPRVLLVGAAAVGLGVCLAAFYLLPVIYEQRWVNIAGAETAGLRPQDGFLFTRSTDVDHDNFNRLVSWVAIAEMVTVLTMAGAAKVWRAGLWAPKYRDLWSGLLVWAVACGVIMFSITNVLWKILPKLEFVQFPWRFLLCLSLCFSFLVAAWVPRRWGKFAVCLTMLLVLVVAGRHFQTPWWDHADDLREMQDNMADGTGYEGVDEYAPVGTDPSELEKDTRKVRVDGSAHAAIHVLYWNPESKMFTAEMSGPDQLALRLFPYPAWKVEVNGRVVQTAAQESTGQMLVPVEAGPNRVQITFIRTWDRTAGGWITLITAVSVGIWAFMARRRTTHAPA